MIQTQTSPVRSPSVNSTVTVDDALNNGSSSSSNGRSKRSQRSQRPPTTKPRKAMSMPATSTKKDLSPLVSKEMRFLAAKDAAKMGQWTRLEEHVVEAVSQDKSEEDAFFLKSGLYNATPRSRMFQIVVEAAALGSMKQRNTVEIVTNDKSAAVGASGNIDNFDNNNDDDEDESDHANNNNASPTIRRQLSQDATTIQIKPSDDPTELVNLYVEFQRAKKKLQALDAEQAMERLEEHCKLGDDWKTLQVELPTSKIPKFQKPIAYMTEGKLRGAVIRGAADMGNARQERLVLEGVFKVHRTCACVYCQKPSPFQTQSYQKLRMRQGWTDNALEEEEGAPMSPQPKPKKKLAASHKSPINNTNKRHFAKLHKRQTLATILSTTCAPGVKNNTEADPNLPSLFKAAASSKHNVKAWKSRAAKAKREAYAALSPDGDSATMGSPTTTRRKSTTAASSAGGGPLGEWVSPRLRKKKLTGFASPRTSRSELPTLDSLDASSPSQSSPSTTKWDDTFLSPRSKQKQKLKLPPLGGADDERLLVPSDKSRPAWAAKNLKPAATKDSKARLRELEDSRHTPAWAAGKDFLAVTSPRNKKRGDAMSMTEHSPFRAMTRSSPTRGVRRNKSFDGEIDEEDLLHQELEGLALESPRRLTMKPALNKDLRDISNKTPLSEDDDSFNSNEDDDFAY